MTTKRKRHKQTSEKHEARKFFTIVAIVTLILILLGYIYYTNWG